MLKWKLKQKNIHNLQSTLCQNTNFQSLKEKADYHEMLLDSTISLPFCSKTMKAIFMNFQDDWDVDIAYSISPPIFNFIGQLTRGLFDRNLWKHKNSHKQTETHTQTESDTLHI